MTDPVIIDLLQNEIFELARNIYLYETNLDAIQERYNRKKELKYYCEFIYLKTNLNQSKRKLKQLKSKFALYTLKVDYENSHLNTELSKLKIFD